MRRPARETWNTGAGFVLATLGGAVGIGNIWRFSYVAGENGGASFIVVYLLCVAAVGMPIMLAEFVLGARMRTDAVAAFELPGAAGPWRAVGGIVALAAFLILSYYSVVAGWTAKYFTSYLVAAVRGLPSELSARSFEAFVSTREPVVWHFAFMAATIAVVAAGVRRGIELSSRVLLPLLAVIVLALAGYALSLEGASRGLAFLFAPDWSRLREPRMYLAALGQAFFSLGVGAGVLVTYAGYIGRTEQLARATFTIAVGDTLFAVIAGVAIFPAVFAFGLDPAQGTALAFVTLPRVFALMPAGAWFATAFFFVLFAAALTSAVALLEVPVAWAMRRFGLGRMRATLAIGAAAGITGLPSALACGALAALRPFGRDVLAAIDYVATDLLLPLGSIGLVIFVAWVFPREDLLASAGISQPRIARLWLADLRYGVPVAIAAVLAAALIA